MKRSIEGEDRTQVSLLPACLGDYVEAENPVRVVDVFVDGLDLDALGFVGVDPGRAHVQSLLIPDGFSKLSASISR